MNPSIWSSVSQHFLTSFPASYLPVATMWHLGSNLSSINSVKIDNLLDSYSSNPSNINKMIFLFWLLYRFLGAEADHQWLPKHQNAFLDISATILLWMLWSRSPEVLAFWWPSRRRTFYSRWFFSYQVLLQSTLFSALNTLHTGLVLTTCQQIRQWFLLSFSFFWPLWAL